MIILGIESSCDETAAAVLKFTDNSIEVKSSIIASQFEEHLPYGGVVPEIAARSHVSNIDETIEKAIKQSGYDYSDIDAIAATSGPGLIGGVMVGLLSAKALAIGLNKPFIGVNHLEGHALSPKLSNNLEFPYLLLLVSGGHCQILFIESVGIYKRLGTTIDDALGEAFDKCAKILGLGYPGGPIVEKRALLGDENRFILPRPLYNREGCDFSFAGLKTAVLRLAEDLMTSNGEITEQNINDICAGFQKSVSEVLINRLKNAISMADKFENIVVAGGVAANKKICKDLENFALNNGLKFHAPELKYCGDNGAMIALAGYERLKLGQSSDLNLKPRPRWPLDETSDPINIKNGYGKKGAKA